ncbi:hypothetical protein KPH14_001026 [Odynerus spinipes]|uniref:Transposase n=1 Tax=Odynerus spinipes TaxID=1348599 RepID=A0AAD9REZ5_9HYME|nr:hypothetical protein KPH14_001026 [Odynerus spinipes]
MSPKTSETQMYERELILKYHKQGKSYREIAELIGRCLSTVPYIIKQSKTEHTVLNKHRTGRPKKLTQREEKMVVREIKKDPHISATKLTQMVAKDFNKNVHPELCRRILRNNNFHGRITRKKPFTSKKNQAKRLKFAKEYIDKDTVADIYLRTRK